MTLVPSWLESLLSTDFFSVCSNHKNASRNECNLFCIDCHNHDAFCFYCRSTRHKDHIVIQIRRSSYHDVVRVAEIEMVLDISGVQTYVINSARVLFLNERPQPKITGKGSSHLCEVCKRSLLDPFRFCSLGCKLVEIKKKGDSSFNLSMKNDHEIKETGERMRPRRFVPVKEDNDEEHDELREGMIQLQDMMRYGSTRSPPADHHHQHDNLPTISNVVPRRSRRKGIPRRAPLGP
ncbi:protein RGF1 INDUCIBLE TRANSCRIPTION FACTOR 1-like isoform X1 [Carya illinoinensis]|uniref:PLATZ transcription factor family protein n=1 Tax=Carya illinoinensis TaxID=32201 RepID=A0A8T1NQH0_CARIL|nr:protein RGF1 INDUCIBLE TRANSCRIPTION FACTOR 1-like isoform X1 [Carya illinoinensis]XP_042956943.1 protein RGF1 INDUCIBLE TRANSCRIPTION FACTOR 1-like isoform X1 [Carya illinoinensis]XP_042956944.1 protein RGF1 INDUCIBLE TRANSCRIPTION FACTOR 1-like isoform X1 [Carya illinoinensis]KAG6632226.1 hypothetical protein CIPAW_13G144000 [Carya illinoinensis]KAG6632228.1 hypothetical protein CIPAW_13G144000 [Carya illinoinensis]